MASQIDDHSGEDDFNCGGFLADGSSSCTGLVVTTSTTSSVVGGVPTMTAAAAFSQPVQKVDYLMSVPVHASTCLDDRSIPGPCYYIDYPQLTGVAYNAAGEIVASQHYDGGGRTYVDPMDARYTTMALYSDSNDVARVEFTTDGPADWTIGYAKFGAAPTVTCTPASQARGDPVDCSTTGFAVVGRWTFTPADAALPVVTEIANRAGAHWPGSLLVAGSVSVDGWVKVSDFPDESKKVAVSKVAILTVTARSWATTRLQLPGIPSFGSAGSLVAAPQADGTGWKMTWGLHQTQGIDLAAMPLITMNGGPNAGYIFLGALPKLKRSVAYLNPALDGVGAWAPRQTGVYQGMKVHPQLHIPFCKQDAFGLLKPHVQRHEGLTGAPAPDSHYGIWQDQFGRSDLPARWEALVATSQMGLLKPLVDAYNAFVTSPVALAPQTTLDTRDDINVIRNWSGGCEFIYQP